MSDKLNSLFREGKIDKYEYDTYLTFEANELGKAYLKNTLEAIVLEEPDYANTSTLAFIDGRRSVWRQIKIVVNKVNVLMEGISYDSSNGSNQHDRNIQPDPDRGYDKIFGAKPLYSFDPPSN